MVTERRKAPIEVMERLAEAFVEWANIPEPPEGPARVRCWVERCQPALSAYRAATAPLRTRASVDADRLQVARELYNQACDHIHFRHRWSELAREPTSDDHGSSSTPAAKESRDNAGVSAGPTNSFTTRHGDRIDLGKEPLEDPEACSCDQAVELQRVLSHVHALALELVQVTETTPG